MWSDSKIFSQWEIFWGNWSLHLAAQKGQGQKLHRGWNIDLVEQMRLLLLPGVCLSINALDFTFRCNQILRLPGIQSSWKSDSLQFNLIMSQWWPQSLPGSTFLATASSTASRQDIRQTVCTGARFWIFHIFLIIFKSLGSQPLDRHICGSCSPLKHLCFPPTYYLPHL